MPGIKESKCVREALSLKGWGLVWWTEMEKMEKMEKWEEALERCLVCCVLCVVRCRPEVQAGQLQLHARETGADETMNQQKANK